MVKNIISAGLKFLPIIVISVALAGCSKQQSTTNVETGTIAASSDAPTKPSSLSRTEGNTVYLTIVSHNEEPSAKRPDYLNDREFYLQNRALLIQLVNTISAHGAAYNFQSDWNFLQAVIRYDQGDVTKDTGGKNIVRWMAEDKGVEIDPHAHESQYNYADVAALIEQLGVAPSHTVGGFLYLPPGNPQGWEKHKAGMSGAVYPGYFWRADILWGASTMLHQGDDDRSSGVWRPLDLNAFTSDDPQGRLIYIGGCTSDETGVTALLGAMKAGRAPTGGFYTATIMLVQDRLTSQDIQGLGVFIDSLAPEVDTGAVRWLKLSQVAETWTSEYGARPFRFDCGSL